MPIGLSASDFKTSSISFLTHSMKLKHYSALTAAFLAMKSESDGQIVYTDIIPDSIMYDSDPANHYPIDLDNDGLADFEFIFSSTSTYDSLNWHDEHQLTVVAKYENQIFGFGTIASALSFGEEIGPNGFWIAGENLLAQRVNAGHCESEAGSNCESWTASSGEWLYMGDRYLGIRLIENTDTIYGWLRLNVHQSLALIKDYAFEMQPGASLPAGYIDCNSLYSELIITPVELCGDQCDTIEVNDVYGLTYQWFKEGQPILDAMDYFYNVCDSGTYSVAYESIYGCSDTSSGVEIIEFPDPVIPTIFQSNDTLFSSSAYSYQWLNENEEICGATNNFFVLEKNSPSYQILTSDSNGCTALSEYFAVLTCQFMDTTINPSGTSTICDGKNINLNVAFSFEVNYQWFRNDSVLGGATQSNYSAYSEGKYHCAISDYVTCYTDTVTIIVLYKPVITQSGDTLISSEPQYNQWYLNGWPISGASGQTYVPLVSGTYKVRVSGTTGCKLFSSPMEIIVSDSPYPETGGEPIKCWLDGRTMWLQFLTNEFENGSIKILNVVGQILKEVSVDNSVIQIPVNQSGLLIIEIEMDGHRFIKPIIIP